MPDNGTDSSAAGPVGGARAGDGAPGEGGPPYPGSERELVVVADATARLQATADGVLAADAPGEAEALTAVLADENITLEPLFGPNEEVHRSRAEAAASAEAAQTVQELARFYRVRADDDRLDALAERLTESPLITAAYVKPATFPATAVTAERPVAVAGLAAATPDFSNRQGYLLAAPGGVDAVWAGAQPGGRGDGVNIVDVEGEWRFTHEDLVQNSGGVLIGTPPGDPGWRNHGTAVMGEFGADHNGFGVEGIAPGATVRGASIFGGVGTAQAIHTAADALHAGDIILLELHRPGPRFSFQDRNDQRGYIAIEWWPDDLAAVRYATARGVIVVGAAGNGAEDLDDALYDQRPAGFPADWRNPFNPANPGSGAVVVGAGAPPPGTHGRDYGPDRSRLGFSNFGARLDAQGWGREVTTTGYGDLQGGADENLWYTDSFSGTSSASPIVVGSIAALQGLQIAAGRPRLTPARAVEVLRNSGSPQQDGPNGPVSQRIGHRPDLRAAAAYVTPVTTSSAVATQYWAELLSYPAAPAARLWLLAGGAWRQLGGASALQFDQVQQAFLGTDSTVTVWYQASTVVGLVVSGS